MKWLACCSSTERAKCFMASLQGTRAWGGRH